MVGLFPVKAGGSDAHYRMWKSERTPTMFEPHN